MAPYRRIAATACGSSDWTAVAVQRESGADLRVAEQPLGRRRRRQSKGQTR